MNPEDIVRILKSRPFVLSDEKKVQADISSLLEAAGVPHKREVALARGDIIDFMLPEGLGMEIKLKAPRKSIFRQCERYCGHSAVTGLILVSATAMGFPAEIKGKPCWVVSLGASWF